MDDIKTWEDLTLHIGRTFEEVCTSGDLAELADELRYFAEKIIEAEQEQGKMQFFRVYAEVVTDPYEARNDLDVELGDAMEAAAQAFYRMSLAGMWDRLTENLEDATIYSN